ncbi:MAG: hypothetical protein AAB152_02510 [Candidatus Coatesbacteria bacterium]
MIKIEDLRPDATIRGILPDGLVTVVNYLLGQMLSTITRHFLLMTTLEIEAEIPDGAPEKVVRTVTQNSRTLKFKSHGFEKE